MNYFSIYRCTYCKYISIDNINQIKNVDFVELPKVKGYFSYWVGHVSNVLNLYRRGIVMPNETPGNALIGLHLCLNQAGLRRLNLVY